MAKDFENWWEGSSGWVETQNSPEYMDQTNQVIMDVGSVLEMSWWHGRWTSPNNSWFEEFDEEYARDNNCQP